MLGWEAEVLRFFEGLRNAVTVPLFEAITFLGEETVPIVLLAVLYFAIDKAFARRMFFVTMLSMSVNGVVKNVVQRPRPFAAGIVSGERLETATSFSFPSGHTQCFATWSTVAALKQRRTWMWIAVGVLTAAVALSRLFLGAHYPTDVAVGALLGIGIAVLGNALFDRVGDTLRLYVGTVAVLTPFAVWFLIAPDPLYDDFFSFYGMLVGFAAAVAFEERTASLDLTVAWWKKALRVVFGVALVLGIKAAFSLWVTDDAVVWALVSDGLRSVAMSFAAFGVCPWLFSRLHL